MTNQAQVAINKMTALYCGDARRINHFLKVFTYASLIGKNEELDEKTQNTLELSAVLHDIGIHESEKLFQNTNGKNQEALGEPLARELLKTFIDDDEIINRVCFLVAHHHTYDKVDGPDYQILLEADYIVNAFEDSFSTDTLKIGLKRVFKTKSGIDLYKKIFNI